MPENPQHFAPGTFGCHEALDRTSLLAVQADELSEHPAIMINPRWRMLAAEAAEGLAQLYQEIGAVHLMSERAISEEVKIGKSVLKERTT